MLLWDRSISIRYCSVFPHILTVIVVWYDMFVRAGLPDSADEAEMEVVTQHPGMPALGDIECATCTAYAGNIPVQQRLARGSDPLPQPSPDYLPYVGNTHLI